MNPSEENLKTFGDLVRHWRQLRGFSQEGLGVVVGHSQRHVSFLENGRTAPSLTTVLNLIDALEIPLRDGNRLRNLVGFADAPQKVEPDWTNLHPTIDNFISHFLESILPHPACIADARHRIVRTNVVQAFWFNRFAEISELFDDGFLSYPRLVFHPEGLRRAVANWDRYAEQYIQVLHRERIRNPEIGEKIFEDIQSLTDLPEEWMRLSELEVGEGGTVMEFESWVGKVTLTNVTYFMTTPPNQMSLEFPDVLLSVLVATDEKSFSLLKAANDAVDDSVIHKNLHPAMVHSRR